MSESRRNVALPDTSDRPGPQCGEESRASVSATVRQESPGIIVTERSTRPSADRKRSRSTSRVVQMVAGASGGQGLLARFAAECRTIRILSRMCHQRTIPHRRTAEEGAAIRADPGLADGGVGVARDAARQDTGFEAPAMARRIPTTGSQRVLPCPSSTTSSWVPDLLVVSSRRV